MQNRKNVQAHPVGAVHIHKPRSKVQQVYHQHCAFTLYCVSILCVVTNLQVDLLEAQEYSSDLVSSYR
jgi:hypothetical protein